MAVEKEASRRQLQLASGGLDVETGSQEKGGEVGEKQS